MPGIAGLATKSKLETTQQTLESMLDAITWDRYQIEKFHNQTGNVSIGLANPDVHNQFSRPFINDDQSLIIFLYGEIYTGLDSRDNAPPKNKLASIYKKYMDSGSSFIEKLSGEFLIVIYDQKLNKLLLFTDRFGRRPLYYAITSDQFLFSSEIKSILACPTFYAKTDKEALADFLSFGYILGERTLIQNVGMMPPASILEYDIESAQHKISRYWDLREHLTPFNKPDSIILDNVSETFKNSVERRLSKKQTNWLSLSGGMDSRTIAAVIDVNNYPAKAVTSGVSGSYERVVTEKIAAAIGCEHLFYEFDEQQLVQSDEDMLELIHEAIFLTDGMRGSSSSAMTAFSARQRQQHNLNPVITGHCGEIMKLDEAYNFAIRNSQDEAAISANPIDWAYTRMCKANAPQFNKSSLYQGKLGSVFSDAPRDHLSSVINNLDSHLPPAQIISYLFINELFRKRALYALMVHRAYTNIRMPFLDDDFLSAVIQAPLHLRSNYKLHAHIIQQHRPELLDIVLTDSRARPFAGRAEKLIKKMPFKLGKALGFYKRDFPEDFFAANSNTEFFRNILLNPRTLERGYVNPASVTDLLNKHEKGQNSVYTLLHLLTIVELWHRGFMD